MIKKFLRQKLTMENKFRQFNYATHSTLSICSIQDAQPAWLREGNKKDNNYPPGVAIIGMMLILITALRRLTRNLDPKK